MGQRSDAKMRDGMRAPDFREEARRSAQGQSPDSVSEPLKKVDQALLASREARAKQKTPPNVRLYQAAHRNYRIQVTCPEDRLDLRIGHKIEGCPEECEDHDFERHPNYGIGRSFWDAQEMVQLAKRRSVEELVRVVRSDPELTDQVLELLGVRPHHAHQ